MCFFNTPDLLCSMCWQVHTNTGAWTKLLLNSLISWRRSRWIFNNFWIWDRCDIVWHIWSRSWIEEEVRNPLWPCSRFTKLSDFCITICRKVDFRVKRGFWSKDRAQIRNLHHLLRLRWSLYGIHQGTEGEKALRLGEVTIFTIFQKN